MPAYNSEQWIADAINSVIAQSYADWELLVVDDCSSDSTAATVNAFAAGDKRIRLISNPINGGPSRSRNKALLEAKGDYISFIDSDDLMEASQLEYLIGLMKKHEADIACGRIVPFCKEEKIVKKRRKIEVTEILNPEEAVARSLYQTGVEASIYGKLYRKELFRDLKFNEGELYEDLSIFYLILLKSRRIIESDVAVYFYRKRKESLIHDFKYERLIVLEVTRRICEYMEENYPQLLPAAIDRRYSANYNMLQLMLSNQEKSDSNLASSHSGKEKYCEGNDKFPINYDAKINECYSYIRQNASLEMKNKNIRRKNRIGALAAKFIPRRILFGLLKII